MLWQIQILTQPSRREFLEKLLAVLEPQVSKYSGEVALQIRTFDTSMTLGGNRQKMRDEADATYVSIVDDDDGISPQYVDKIFPLLDGVDYIGFKLQAYEDGVALRGPTYHSLMCGGWWENEWAWYRDISHLNPIRLEHALRAPIYGGFGEDSRWASEIRRLKILRVEHYIDDTLYHYFYRNNKTDSVVPGRFSAGRCPKCGSESTVVVDFHMCCNSCGCRQEERYTP